MNRLFISFAFLLIMSLNAQVKVPAASPATKVSQTVGLTEVEIQYNRPSTKGRKIFGDLVPFGKMWRTGANLNSTISFSDDIVIDGKTLPKGKYSIFVTPKVDAWEVFFYKDVDNWGIPEKWSDERVALSTTAKPQVLSQHIETFTLAINQLNSDFAHLDLSWEKTLISIKFEVPTQKNAMASINKTMAGPAFSDYYAAAQYYFMSDNQMPKALEYINKAIELKGSETPFWYTRLKSQIQAKLGDKKGAIETAKISLVAAEKAANADYVKMNKDSIAEWSK